MIQLKCIVRSLRFFVPIHPKIVFKSLSSRSIESMYTVGKKKEPEKPLDLKKIVRGRGKQSKQIDEGKYRKYSAREEMSSPRQRR